MYDTKANRKKLADALRSGEYKQGAGNLTFRMPFDPETEYDCCLGVACKLFTKENPDVLKPNRRDFSGHLRTITLYVENGYFQYGTFLPQVVMEWLGFKTENGTCYLPEGGTTSLATLNDHGTPFSKIADIIESEPKGLCL